MTASDEPMRRKSPSLISWVGLLILLVTIYVLMPGPIRWAVRNRYVPDSFMKPIVVVFAPLEWSYHHNDIVRKFYDSYFRLLGLK